MGTAKNIRPYYTIECYLGEIEISHTLEFIRLSSSINAPYQNVIIGFTIDSQDMSTYNLFGKEDIKLFINLMTENMEVVESISLNLITINISFPLSVKPDKLENVNPKTDKIQTINIVKEPFKNMTKPVNKVYDEFKQLTPIEIVQDLANTFLDVKTEIKTQNSNTTPCQQTIIAPMTFIDAVRYVDDRFGIFNGPSFFYTKFENNTFCLWDLKAAVTNFPPLYHITQLSQFGAANNKIFEDSGQRNDRFYTTNISAIYRGNQDIMSGSYKTVYCSKPLDSLYEWKSFNMTDVFNNNAVVTGGTLDVHPAIKDRVEYKNINEIGNEHNDEIYLSKISRVLSSMNEISFSVGGNLKILKLSCVGVPIKFIPMTTEYADFRGSYVVNSSTIEWKRENTMVWEALATIKAFRGNLKE